MPYLFLSRKLKLRLLLKFSFGVGSNLKAEGELIVPVLDAHMPFQPLMQLNFVKLFS